MTRLHILALGKAGKGPESQLVEDYRQRISRQGRQIGIGPLEVIELETRGKGQKGADKAAEAELLMRHVPKGAALVTLDERGRMLSSPDLARWIGRMRDEGHSDIAFIIGGADGLDPSMRERADLVLSFGPMVWPHLLARAMLAEQLYRATSILAGSPYHRA